MSIEQSIVSPAHKVKNKNKSYGSKCKVAAPPRDQLVSNEYIVLYTAIALQQYETTAHPSMLNDINTWISNKTTV